MGVTKSIEELVHRSPEELAGSILQRLCERREEWYVELLWPTFRLLHDLDDTRQARDGVYYSQKKPPKLAALEDLPGI